MVRAYASLLFGALVVATSLGACAEASTDTAVGGEPLFDAAAPPGPTTTPTAAPDTGTGGGITFSDLYRDFFGPTGAASCAGGSSGCHGAPGDSGGGVFVCAGDKSACRTAIAGFATGATFADSFLFSILRKNPAAGANRMPKAPKTYTFEKDAIDRIAAWAAAGAKDD